MSAVAPPAFSTQPSGGRQPSHRGSSAWVRFRYRFVPDHVIGEILAKPWIDTAIPAIILAIVLGLFAIFTPNFYSPASLSDLARVLGEYQFIAIGVTIVMIAGGIDLSVGSIFALCNLVALALVYKLQLHVLIAFPLTILGGAALGMINGLLVGYLRLRAFLTTLVMLIIWRAVVDIITVNYSSTLMDNSNVNGDAIWDFLGVGFVLGIPTSFFIAVVVAVLAHVVLTRMRLGWHILAVGGARRSAFNAGINVRRTICLTYAIAGAMTGTGAFFYAARLNTVGISTGAGMELIVITGAVLGGISLGGGRGSITKASLGTITILCVSNGILRMGLASGGSSMVLGLLLVLAVAFDIRWTKNRHKVLARTYVSPNYYQLPPLPDTSQDANTPYAMNDSLHDVGAIGLGEIEGPEDVILDEDDNLYSGNRHGDIVRFFPPDYKKWEVFVHIGGHPLGMALDKDGSILVCVAGMGLYRVTQDREVIKLSDQTNRSTFSIIDDSRVRLADDVDIAPDGKFYYSDPTIRYELSDWLLEAVEMRPNGRLICYDPKDGSTRTVVPKLYFPNGVCLAHDRKAILLNSTWGCHIDRYWLEGPKKGKLERFVADLPGYPDNINRASDGGYWCALVGMRSPVFDLLLSMPDTRKRMIHRVAPDNWIFANTNSGCILKIDENGKVLQSLWDLKGDSHSHITSMREHKGRLFIGGLRNNRIGVYDIPGADPNWTGYQSYWGTARDRPIETVV
jgi:ribose transport system permease protein